MLNSPCQIWYLLPNLDRPAYEEEQSALLATNNQQVRRARHTAEDIEFEDLMRLMDMTMASIKSENQSISNQMTQIDQQRESLRMQLLRKAGGFLEPSTQCIK